MSNTIYTPGTIGQTNGYNLDASAIGKLGANNQPLYPQFRNGASLIQLDIVIVNSMTTALQVEMFNYFRSQTRTYFAQNQANNYYPVGIDDTAGQPGATNGTYTNPNIKFASTTANGYIYGIFEGAYDSYVNAAGPAIIGATRNQVFFDIYGNQVYQPGYLPNATLPTGNVIISCNQMPWIQLFEFSGENKFIFDSIKFTFNSQAQTLQMAQTVYHKYFSSTGVATNSENYTPSTFFNEGNYQSNIITVPVDKKNTPQWGIWYTILGQQAATNTQATLTMFLWIDNDALKTSSSPRA